jgi:hypothetical protein
VTIGRDVPLKKKKAAKFQVHLDLRSVFVTDPALPYQPKDHNEGYPEEVSLVPPPGAKALISKRAQNEEIQVLLDLGMQYIIGLFLFVDGNPKDRKEQVKVVLIQACNNLMPEGALQHVYQKLRERIQNDTWFFRNLFNYVCDISRQGSRSSLTSFRSRATIV